MKKKIFIITKISFLIIAVVSVVLISAMLLTNGTTQKFRKDKKEKSVLTLKKGKFYKNPIDWEALKKTNPEVYAWVYIPGTSIDYAVAQSGRNKQEDFYLHHNIYGYWDYAGMIYSRKENSRNFQDPLTVLYGHNMINGSMFAGISKFENKDFIKENNKIYIYTPDAVRVYKIKACGYTDTMEILSRYGYVNKKRKYIKKENSKKFIKMTDNLATQINIDIDSKDRILLLSTCRSRYQQRRILVSKLEIEQKATD